MYRGGVEDLFLLLLSAEMITPNKPSFRSVYLLGAEIFRLVRLLVVCVLGFV